MPLLLTITATQVSSNTPVQTSLSTNQDTSTACVLSCSQSPTVIQSVDSSGSQWRSQDLPSSGAQNGRACAPVKILKPRPFPVKIYVFRVCTRALHDQSRCRSAKYQYASEQAHAITTTRLPVVIVYVR